MKKILALLVGATMTFTSVVANAAFTTMEKSGTVYQIWDSNLTDLKADADARNIVVDVAVKHLTQDEADASGISEDGWDTLSVDDYDFYSADIDIKGVGDLLKGKNNKGKAAELRLFAADLYLQGMPEAYAYLVKNESTNIPFKAGYDANTAKGTSITWSAGSSDASYPTTDNTRITVDQINAELDNVVIYFAYAKNGGESQDISAVTAAGQMSYYATVAGETPSIVWPATTAYSLGTVTLNGAATADGKIAFAPKAEETAKPIAFEAKELTKVEGKGYIWTLTFAEWKNLSTLTAKFVADTEESIDKTFYNVADIVSDFEKVVGGEEGAYVLNVGLITARNLVEATFTGDDADNADTPACVKSVKYTNN